MKHHPKNPYLKELNHQEAQQAHYERGVRITGDTDPAYAHNIHDTITTLETKAEHWEYENHLKQHNLHPILLPRYITDNILSLLVAYSAYEDVTAKLTITYNPADHTLHIGIFSVVDGEVETTAVTHDFNIPNEQALEYKAFTEPCEFTYQPDPETENLTANTAVFLPELSHTEGNRKKILRPHGLYLLTPKP
jgi:hypothetical protein